MLQARLVRRERAKDGTFGELHTPFSTYMTMEDDWLNNEKGKSCIPAGRYLCQRTIFHKHNIETFEITGVPNRSRILFHVANTEEDVEGCVGIGTRPGLFRVLDEDDPAHPMVLKRGVANSKQAFDRFMRDFAEVDEFELIVEWASEVIVEVK